jgi:hypothetical protein
MSILKVGLSLIVQLYKFFINSGCTSTLLDVSFEIFSPMRLAWPKRPKIVCSLSNVDIRSRANTTRGLDFKHMLKVRAHKGGVRIGKTPKKLASICCP